MEPDVLILKFSGVDKSRRVFMPRMVHPHHEDDAETDCVAVSGKDYVFGLCAGMTELGNPFTVILSPSAAESILFYASVLVRR